MNCYIHNKSSCWHDTYIDLCQVTYGAVCAKNTHISTGENRPNPKTQINRQFQLKKTGIVDATMQPDELPFELSGFLLFLVSFFLH